MKCSFILCLEGQAVVQAATSGAHHQHQLLICILHRTINMSVTKHLNSGGSGVFESLKRELKITCSLSSSWLEIWSDWSPSALVFSSVTLCSNSFRLSSTSDNVYKIHNIFNEYIFSEATVNSDGFIFVFFVYLLLVSIIPLSVWMQVCPQFLPSSVTTGVYFHSEL